MTNCRVVWLGQRQTAATWTRTSQKMATATLIATATAVATAAAGGAPETEVDFNAFQNAVKLF